jgi:hypothetical protein
MKKSLGHPIVFVLVYLIFMLPTYFLPWLGSNSAVFNAAAASSDTALNPAFWLHLGCLAVLIAVAWCRGAVLDRKWLVILPILAAVFDLTPGLNWIPGVPTIMHIAVIICGVALRPVESVTPARA